MVNLITVATFGQAHELAVVRARLEWEGIPCHLKDEFTVQAHPFYSNAIGGIKLQVASEDVDRARAILVEAGVLHHEETEGPLSSEVEYDTDEPLHGPGLSSLSGRQLAWVLVAIVIVAAILSM
jgi:hypothetical protein